MTEEQGYALDETHGRLVAEMSNELLFVTDREGMIEWASPSAHRVLGFPPVAMVGEKVVEYVHPADVEVVVASREKVDQGGEVGYRVRLRRVDGTHLWGEVAVRPMFGDNGELVARYGIFRSIQVQVVLEQQLIECEQALRASIERLGTNRASSQSFQARFSHEMRNLLGIVLGHAQLAQRLADQIGHEDNERLSSVIAAVVAGATRSSRLVEEVLDASVLAGTRRQIPLSDVELSDAVRVAVEDAAAAFPSHPSPVVHSCPSVMVRASERHLGLVLFNLISNALKYNRPGGRVVLTCELAGESVRVLVADEGSGVGESDRVAIFEMFARGPAEEMLANGYGVGLAVSSELMAAMDGSIELVSTSALGSTFGILLRRASVSY